jgi:predicted RNA binding protein YcfA (HicA-like mRNA interferase family)
MTNLTQKERIIIKLEKDGFVTRNECLSRFISRLGAIIKDLEYEGWEFYKERFKGDYKYIVKENADKQKKLL